MCASPGFPSLRRTSRAAVAGWAGRPTCCTCTTGRAGWRRPICAGTAPRFRRWWTIHNIAYQGNFPAAHCPRLAIPEAAFDINGVEFHGEVSFLKAGLYFADHVTTVSPSYAREIATPRSGGGLHGLIQGRAARGELSGIVNGIDESWDPRRDPYLPYHFDANDLSGKRANAEAVRTSLCLRHSDGPLFGIVSRLVHQKGLDLVAEAARDIVGHGGQIAILGLGDPDIEHVLSRTARQHRDNVAVLVGFNEPMARRIIAGSDFTLMPSRFEPCGLTQMQAQHYGALPVAHATGGLVDTIEEGVTGFLFSTLTYGGLLGACARAFDAFGDPGRLAAMRQAAMARRFTWAEPAAEYAALYLRLAGATVLLEAARPMPAVADHLGIDAGRGQARPRVRAAVDKALEAAAA